MTLFELSAIRIYFCPTCGQHTEAPLVEDDDNYCPDPDCGGTVRQDGVRAPCYVSVALYAVERVYGGPEEGGWYYDAGDVVRGTAREFEAADAPQADLYRELLWTRANAEMTAARKDGYSVRFNVRVEAEAPAAPSYPTRRPHYC